MQRSRPVSRSRSLPQVPIADVLAFTIHVLEVRDAMLGERVEIASDEISAEQAADIVSGLLGRRVMVADPPTVPANPLFAWLERVARRDPLPTGSALARATESADRPALKICIPVAATVRGRTRSGESAGGGPRRGWVPGASYAGAFATAELGSEVYDEPRHADLVSSAVRRSVVRDRGGERTPGVLLRLVHLARGLTDHQ
jgi:hypothetical protein